MPKTKKWSIWRLHGGQWILVRDASVRLGRSLRSASRFSRTTSDKVIVAYAKLSGEPDLSVSFPPTVHAMRWLAGAHHANVSHTEAA